MMKSVTPKKESRKDFELTLDEIATEGARRLLIHALNLEVEQYIQSHKDKVDEKGRRFVVRNGVSKTRTITMGGSTVEFEGSFNLIKEHFVIREGNRLYSPWQISYEEQQPF